MPIQVNEKYIHKIFVWSLILKSLNALLQILGGVALLLPGTLTNVVAELIRNELIEDPTDFIATHVQELLPLITEHTHIFACIFLLSHGIIKLFLVFGLIRNKLWAYPTAIIVFSLFIVYQIYQYLFTPSIFLILFTVFDLIIIALTLHEYKYLKKYRFFPE